MSDFMIHLRKKLINGWNRAFYIGKYKDFPEWCDSHNLKFDRSFFRADLEGRPIAKIESCKIKVGNLRTDLFGAKYKMRDSLVMMSLKGEVEYSTYLTKLESSGDFSHRWLDNGYPFNILEHLRENPDFLTKCPVVVNNKDVIQDGQHRACCFLIDNGEDALIPAIRIYTLPAEGSLIQKLARHLFGKQQ